MCYSSQIQTFLPTKHPLRAMLSVHNTTVSNHQQPILRFPKVFIALMCVLVVIDDIITVD